MAKPPTLPLSDTSFHPSAPTERRSYSRQQPVAVAFRRYRISHPSTHYSTRQLSQFRDACCLDRWTVAGRLQLPKRRRKNFLFLSPWHSLLYKLGERYGTDQALGYAKSQNEEQRPRRHEVSSRYSSNFINFGPGSAFIYRNSQFSTKPTMTMILVYSFIIIAGLISSAVNDFRHTGYLSAT